MWNLNPTSHLEFVSWTGELRIWKWKTWFLENSVDKGIWVIEFECLFEKKQQKVPGHVMQAVPEIRSRKLIEKYIYKNIFWFNSTFPSIQGYCLFLESRIKVSTIREIHLFIFLSHSSISSLGFNYTWFSIFHFWNILTN